MIIIKRNCTPPFRQEQVKIHFMLAICLIMLNGSKTFAQDTLMAYSSTKAASYANKTLFGGTITNSGYGGIILKFSSFNDKFAFMTGGRGAITINNRYTIGGGGYGIANSIVLTDSGQDTSRYFKMGYGGVESGYIFFFTEKGKNRLFDANCRPEPHSCKTVRQAMERNYLMRTLQYFQYLNHLYTVN